MEAADFPIKLVHFYQLTQCFAVKDCPVLSVRYEVFISVNIWIVFTVTQKMDMTGFSEKLVPNRDQLL